MLGTLYAKTLPLLNNNLLSSSSPSPCAMSSSSPGKPPVAASTTSDGYDSIRTSVLATGDDSRVEVNQRSLIDKILARYATAGAVYRELLQNSNDAEAATAQIHFTTCPVPTGAVVTEVVYKNDGLPFRSHDWSRLRKIAEGNPDASKVGAFGVGAYTMFSICEEPMVVSGGQAMAFSWRGDALWVKVGKAPGQLDKWTSFVLKSRDPYPVPDLVELGQFLCSSLTFTACLKNILVYVNGEKRLTISKREVHEPRIVTPPKASSWWSGDGAVTTSPKRIFSLGRTDGSITETIIEMSVDLDGDISKKRARYVSAIADTRVPSDMVRRMQRVTKKRPPSQVKIEVFIDADSSSQGGSARKGKAAAITGAFSPGMGAGRVFIGFKTSQTTGLAAHLAAPLLPTVEREAIDFQDPTLRVYNCELLAISGILMRLTLEHSMSLVGEQYAKTEAERLAYEAKEKKKQREEKRKGQTSAVPTKQKEAPAPPVKEEPYNPLFSFAKFMSSGVKKIANVISSVDFLGDEDGDVLSPPDSRPLSKEEKDAILLMRSFSPQQSTPDAQVGTVLANGFQMCLPGLSPPVLTNSGMVRGLDSRLPFQGIEGFVKQGVIRRVILKNAESYLLHVAGCRLLTLQDLITYLRSNPLLVEDVVRLLTWWTKYSWAEPAALTQSQALKQSISFTKGQALGANASEFPVIVIPLRRIEHCLDSSIFTSELPMPPSVLPRELLDNLPARVLADRSLASWFSPLPLELWVHYIADHRCLTDGKAHDADVRLRVLKVLSCEYSKLSADRQTEFGRVVSQRLSCIRCIPVEGQSNSSCETDFPPDLYLSSAELDIFHGLGSFRTVSSELVAFDVSEKFLVTLGVRKSISIDFLFTQLDRLKWNRNPQPLIKFLRSTSLTQDDLEKLKSTQYLPEVNDKSRTYAPAELYLPNEEVRVFPFVKTLQWPSYPLHENSPDGEFLKKLGCHVDPPLKTLMEYLTSDIKNQEHRRHGIDFLYKRLAAGGPYVREYNNYLDKKFLPATIEEGLRSAAPRIELKSPNSCYSSECSCLGFPILSTSFKRGGKLGYDQILRCATKPSMDLLVHHLITLVGDALQIGSDQASFDRVLKTFERTFAYMSSRSTELNRTMIDKLSKTPFIPQGTGNSLQWFRPREIYFESTTAESSDLTRSLFPVRAFNPFLATMGVRSHPTTEDVFQLVMSSPHKVLQKMGSESKYLSLLRRIAANPPYQEITSEMKSSAFLLAIRLDKVQEGDAGLSAGNSDAPIGGKYSLAKAADICIIDNSRFSRMFDVLAAPQESEIERFYASLGSPNMSSRIRQKFLTKGGNGLQTELTRRFRDRITDRKPLLVSSVVSRQLLPEALILLSDDSLQVYEVSSILANYYFMSQKNTENTTCSGYIEAEEVGASASGSQGRDSKAAIGRKRVLSLFITQELDWFHVGNAIGNVILKRCSVQDAFFIGSLLEAPLSQLRARGFPVDRILRAAEPVQKECVEEEGVSVKPEPESRAGITASEREPKSPQEGPRPADNEEARVKPHPGGHVPDSNVTGQARTSGVKKQKSDLLSRAVQGFRAMSGSNTARSAGLKPSVSVETPRGIHVRPGVNQSTQSDSSPDDAANHARIEEFLKSVVRSTRHVSAKRKHVHIPSKDSGIAEPAAMAEDSLTCDAAIVEDLVLFNGPNGTAKTPSGMRVFASGSSDASVRFLATNWNIVECFDSVLATLCEVYSLRMDTVAIFHDPEGRTVAFNSARRLFFNIRYFANLHYRSGTSPQLDCYAHWWSVVAHELAHNVISDHNREHGFLTERYTQAYLGTLISVLKLKGDVAGL